METNNKVLYEPDFYDLKCQSEQLQKYFQHTRQFSV